MRRPQETDFERRLRRPSVLLAEYATGLGYETVRFLPQGIDTALTRGFEGGVEAVLLLGLSPLAAMRGIRTINEGLNARGNPNRRYTNVTLRLLPNAALIGASLNGFQQYFDRVPDTGVYLQRLAIGGVEGAGVALLPYLLYLGHRHGVYGRIGNRVSQAVANVRNGVYNFGHTRGWW